MSSKNKQPLAFITDPVKRREVFEIKRKELIKKVSEISRIYKVDACAVIYNPFEPDAEPKVWPSKVGAKAVLTRWRNLPESERVRYMINFPRGGPPPAGTPEAPPTDDESDEESDEVSDEE